MRKTVLAIAFLLAFAAPAAAQKARIEAANGKWMELFNKGDFAGIAELYTADAVAFPPFDRGAMFEQSRGKRLGELLDTFAQVRKESLERLATLNLTDADLSRRGRHPEFGVVTLGQHLSTWVAHDLGHISQIVRVMARQYTDAVGPWKAYLSILKRP